MGTKTWFVMRRINGRMVRHSLGRYPDLSLAKARQNAAEALDGLIDDSTMRRLNYEVDGRKRTPADVAHEFLRTRGLTAR